MNRTSTVLEVNAPKDEGDEEDADEGTRARSSGKKALGKPLTKLYRASQTLSA